MNALSRRPLVRRATRALTALGLAVAGAAAVTLTPAAPPARAIIAGGFEGPSPWVAQMLSFHVFPPTPCTATVVAPRWVVTAAHCGPANPDTLTLSFGNAAPIPAALPGLQGVATPELVAQAMAVPGSSGTGSLGRVRPVSAHRAPVGDVMLVELSAPAPAPPVLRAGVDPAPGSILRFLGFGQFALNSPIAPVLLSGDTRLDRMAPRGGSWIGLNSTVRGGYGLGDSGGPIFQGDRLVGLHSGSDHSRQGPDGRNPGWYESIPAQNRWIDSMIR